jgi:hypothetical protein
VQWIGRRNPASKFMKEFKMRVLGVLPAGCVVG